MSTSNTGRTESLLLTAGFSRRGTIKAMLRSLPTVSRRCWLHSKCHTHAGGMKAYQNQDPSMAKPLPATHPLNNQH